ncbi:MAG TPA: hypothetical protein VLG11_04600 [Candidatus Saccharimonadales bacterium]|nr:hypothetical protein [Candidatus Saccharimonadales bacterium]
MQAAQAHGWRVTSRASEADVVVAHSGGCWIVPETNATKTILLANPPCDYKGSLLHNTNRKVALDYKAHKKAHDLGVFARKHFWNGVYFFTHVPRHLAMFKLTARYKAALPSLHAQKIIVTSTKGDPWTGNISLHNIATHPGYCFLSMPDGHDDLWLHPERYLDIIES